MPTSSHLLCKCRLVKKGGNAPSAWKHLRGTMDGLDSWFSHSLTTSAGRWAVRPGRNHRSTQMSALRSMMIWPFTLGVSGEIPFHPIGKVWVRVVPPDRLHWYTCHVLWTVNVILHSGTAGSFMNALGSHAQEEPRAVEPLAASAKDLTFRGSQLFSREELEAAGHLLLQSLGQNCRAFP